MNEVTVNLEFEVDEDFFDLMQDELFSCDDVDLSELLDCSDIVEILFGV